MFRLAISRRYCGKDWVTRLTSAKSRSIGWESTVSIGSELARIKKIDPDYYRYVWLAIALGLGTYKKLRLMRHKLK